MLAAAGTELDLVMACPFHPDFTLAYGAEHARWRKPAAGMLHFAAEALGLELAASWLIGDQASDIAAAKAAGLRGAFFVQAPDAAAAKPTDALDFAVTVSPADVPAAVARVCHLAPPEGQD